MYWSFVKHITTVCFSPENVLVRSHYCLFLNFQEVFSIKLSKTVFEKLRRIVFRYSKCNLVYFIFFITSFRMFVRDYNLVRIQYLNVKNVQKYFTLCNPKFHKMERRENWALTLYWIAKFKLNLSESHFIIVSSMTLTKLKKCAVKFISNLYSVICTIQRENSAV